jgi:hypothetical protein
LASQRWRRGANPPPSRAPGLRDAEYPTCLGTNHRPTDQPEPVATLASYRFRRNGWARAASTRRLIVIASGAAIAARDQAPVEQQRDSDITWPPRDGDAALILRPRGHPDSGTRNTRPGPGPSHRPTDQPVATLDSYHFRRNGWARAASTLRLIVIASGGSRRA